MQPGLALLRLCLGWVTPRAAKDGRRAGGAGGHETMPLLFLTRSVRRPKHETGLTSTALFAGLCKERGQEMEASGEEWRRSFHGVATKWQQA